MTKKLYLPEVHMPDEDGHPSTDEMNLGTVMSALADPLRRRVVSELMREPDGAERNCSSFELPVTKSTRTYLFRVLRESGLVCDSFYGNRRAVSLRRAEIDARFPGLLTLLEAEEQQAGARGRATGHLPQSPIPIGVSTATSSARSP
ncbi:MAG: hypothetical protein QOG18_119 [Microbacteriaceae bacterium]|jgi:DNA-binding transcriptional ArsR family regulator|nr:helix-turn-helix transcriptional regulator [Microbacteriaceae bacterium]MDQ1525506.1 hypothetical protein [Microbacteriaceae bacterium]